MLRLSRYAFGAALVSFLGFLYFRTLAPGLTWAYDGADGGDLIAAAALGGVPHPTGYPTYLLLASAFLRIPFGSLAYRTNLLSLVCTLGAALVIYVTVLAIDGSIVSAMIAGVAFGTFPLIWSQAIITEVNALHALVITGILYFVVVAQANPLRDIAGGLLAGLGLGNHMSTILTLPLLGIKSDLVQGGQDKEKEEIAFVGVKSGVRRVIGVLIGLSVYATIPLRAAQQAPVNWGNAIHWNGFVSLVTGRMYWERLGHFDGSYLWMAFRGWGRFLISQVDILSLLLIFIALSLVFKRSRFYIATGWLAAVYSVFAILYYSPDSYVYLIPVLVSVSIWIGVGGHWLLDKVPASFPILRPALGIALLGVFVIRAVLAIPNMDLSNDRIAEEFAQKTLQTAPQGAILLASGDEATFSLWYRHFANRERPDMAVVSSDLLPQAWYREVLMQTYPGLTLPDGLFLSDWRRVNLNRRVCSVDLEAGLVCQD